MKRILKPAAATVAAIALLALATTAGKAATTIEVSLWDKGADVEMPTDLLYGMPGVDLSNATMGIKLSQESAPHGVVGFKVKNDSKDTEHEMIVTRLAQPGKPLPYIESEQRVDEDKAGDKGEVSELDPGESGSLTLNLEPGDYLLYCNVAGHYAAGMWVEFTVTP